MKVPLVGGFYQARSLVADAQRCVNLYAEKNPEDTPFPYTLYPTPGLTLALTLPTMPVRGLYTTGQGQCFAVGGASVYSISAAYVATLVGTIGTSSGPVSMSDNGLVMVLVDGSQNGYYVDITQTSFTLEPITAAAFYGADRVDEVDGFFGFNQPGTANWYISTSLINAALLTGGAVLSGTIYGGTGYTNGLHASVPLTGGSGAGCVADVTVSGNAVTAVSIDTTQISAPYQVGDVLSADPASLGGAITGQSASGGIGYTAGTYTGVALSGGSGSGAIGTLTVSAAGVVTNVALTTIGLNYVVGDTLTAPSALIGGTGTGFSLTVTSISTGGLGFTYTVTSVEAGDLAFDSLDIVAKSGSADILVSLIAVHREFHLYGSRTSEVWYDAGTADFAFGEIQGVFYEHGCAAKASVAKTDLQVFWLGLDKQGQAMVFMEQGYGVRRVSTHAIENKIQGYSVINDAIGFTYQIQGHVFYVLTFPTADRTWVYDTATEVDGEGWHEWVWTDDNGLEHRARANCQTQAFGQNFVGDWQNGNIYELDINNYTDNGQAIVRRRSFMHLVNEGKRVSYDRFIAEMDVAESVGTTDTNTSYALTLDAASDTLLADELANSILVYQSTLGPFVNLRYSDTRGKTWGNPIQISVGAQGEWGRSMQARQLGTGRDRVFEVFWDGAFKTALSGAYVDVTLSES